MTHLYKGPFPSRPVVAPGLVPLSRPTFSAPMPLVSSINSNKIVADQNTQSVAQPIFSKATLEERPSEIQNEPTQENVIGPTTVLKVSFAQ